MLHDVEGGGTGLKHADTLGEGGGAVVRAHHHRRGHGWLGLLLLTLEGSGFDSAAVQLGERR